MWKFASSNVLLLLTYRPLKLLIFLEETPTRLAREVIDSLYVFIDVSFEVVIHRSFLRSEMYLGSRNCTTPSWADYVEARTRKGPRRTGAVTRDTYSCWFIIKKLIFPGLSLNVHQVIPTPG